MPVSEEFKSKEDLLKFMESKDYYKPDVLTDEGARSFMEGKTTYVKRAELSQYE